MNIKKVKGFFATQSQATKSDIVEATGLSFPTVTRLLKELCALNQIIEIGNKASTGGRCPIEYLFNYDYACFLLIRIELHQIDWTIKNLKEEIIESGSIQFEQQLLHSLNQLLQEKTHQLPQLKNIVIGISARVENQAITDQNFQEIVNLNLQEYLEEKCSLPVVIENDMNTVAMGQYYRYQWQYKATACIYFGSNGLGGGLTINGEVWHGFSKLAGEFGFLSILNDNEWAPLLKEEDKLATIYLDLLTIYTVTINPEVITIYLNDTLDKYSQTINTLYIDKFKNVSKAKLLFSTEFKEDYEKGQYSIAYYKYTNGGKNNE